MGVIIQLLLSIYTFLTYFPQVLFNLAVQYTNNEMYTEAIATYQAITRNRMFSNSARLKVNMGNIYVKMGQLSQAIKMYRMAFDQAPIAHKDLR